MFLSDTQVKNFLQHLQNEFTALKSLIMPITEAVDYTIITSDTRAGLASEVKDALAAGWKVHSYSSALVELALPAPIQDILDDLPGLVVYHQVMVK